MAGIYSRSPSAERSLLRETISGSLHVVRGGWEGQRTRRDYREDPDMKTKQKREVSLRCAEKKTVTIT